jgi:predicted GIY-YIG superfamily endonuclease
VWHEDCATRGDALRQELAVKAMPRRAKLSLAGPYERS